MKTPDAAPPLLVALLATAGGAGYVPGAPGHSGSLVGVGMAWLLSRAGVPIYWIASAGIVGVGIWASERFGQWSGKSDDQRIVIDEVAGVLVTLGLGSIASGAAHAVRWPFRWPELLLGFLLFRLFDVWKPPPVRQLDAGVAGGLGVMVDDLAAAVYAGLVLAAVIRLGLVEQIQKWVTG